jgi:hypothetical protein
MSITLIELSQNLQSFANDLTGQQQGVLMQKLGLDALALIKKRVQQTGINAEGEKFDPYSTEPMLVGKKSFKTEKAWNKIAGSKPKRKELKWVTIGGDKGFSSFLEVSSGGVGPSESGGKHLFELKEGYKEFRELHSRQTEYVDFVFSGRLFGNIKENIPGDVKITSDQAELNSGVVTIAATQELEKKKLSGLTKRKGEILALSKKEEIQLSGYYDKWVGDLLHKNGL